MIAPKDIPGFTWNPKAQGWYRSYKNRPLYCGGRKATREQVEAKYHRKKIEVDGGEVQPAVPRSLCLRDATSLYIAAMEDRRDTGKPRRLSARSFHNNRLAVNDFGKFIGGDRALDKIGPEDFAAYARRFGQWKASGFDSVVTRLGTFFRWCEEMKYITEYAPGPAFRRPAKHEITDDRVGRQRRFSAMDIARLYDSANHTVRCWIGLGVCCAFNNSDVANLTREAVDLDAGVVDFRRRKTGRVRRVCPLHADVVADLKQYQRPQPTAESDAGLFFVSRHGHAYSRSRKGDGKPCDSISRLFGKLIESTEGVEQIAGRNFAGLRTSFANLAPPNSRDEVEMIMGHAHGSILKDHYLEHVDLDRLRCVVDHVWEQVKTQLADVRESHLPADA